jgi:hypothetical protein
VVGPLREGLIVSRICHDHCPPGTSVLGLLASGVVIAVIASAVVQVVASLAAAVMVTGFAVLAVAVLAGALYVKRQTAQIPIEPEAVPAAVIAPARRAVARAPLALPAASSGSPAAHLITDAQLPVSQRARRAR